MHLSVDLAAAIAEALSHQPFHKQASAGASSLKEDSHLHTNDLLLPGRDEKFDDEERDESMSQCSTLVSSDAPNEAPGVWQRNLDQYCIAQSFAHPLYSIVSDKRGGRTAWSCTLSVAGETFAARYWYDGQYVQNAKEDAAELALQSLNLRKLVNRKPGYGQSATIPASDNNDSGGFIGNLSSNSSATDSSAKPRKSQRTQRAYPSSSVDTSLKPETEVDDSPTKWVHWCVDATKTRLHEICVEAQTGAKRGREFINELIDSYRRLRGIRWWLSLTDCATVKVVKAGRFQK